MFWELCKRRNQKLKYERFAAAQAAAAVYNVHRGKDTPVITAMDFVRDERQTEKKERLTKARLFIRKTIGSLPMMTPMETLIEKRLRVIEDLKADGYDNAEELFDEAWPHLKPKDTE
jgi:hypothetical protein